MGREKEKRKNARDEKKAEKSPRKSDRAGNEQRAILWSDRQQQDLRLSAQGPPETNAGIRLITSIYFIILCRRGIELFRVVECPRHITPTSIQLSFNSR